VNRRHDGTPVPAHHFTTTGQREHVPSQSWPSSHLQFDQGRNDGFVASVEDIAPDADASVAMGYWTAEDLPFYAGLARTFPLADRWFSPCLGPTFPNRRFLIAATAHGLIDDEIASIIDYPRSGTIFDLLNRHGIGWINYHHVPALQLIGKRLTGVRSVRALTLLARQLLPGIEAHIRGELQCTANLYPLGLARTIGHLRRIEHFFQHRPAVSQPADTAVTHDPLASQRCSQLPKEAYKRVHDGIRCPTRNRRRPPMHDLPIKQSRRTYPATLPAVSGIHY
jgi:hypothetical protein